MNALRRWRRLLTAAAVAVVVIVVLSAPACMPGGYGGAITDHFDGKRFHNVPASRTIDKPFTEVLRWMLSRDPGPWEWRRDTLYYTPPQRSDDALRVTFVNHATVLLQAGGINVLTDPVWSARVSPLPFTGPRRFREPGIRFTDLPPIDAVLISHNHYDHMDVATISDLAERDDPLFIVPLGNARYLQPHGVERIVELDWWGQWRVADTVTVHAVPAQHWSRRTPYDTNKALWGGFYVETPAGAVYHAGDTGMGPHFAAIQARLGPPRLALLPIGAYLPRWFMAPQHIDPAEAVSAHVLLGARSSMAIHFGTFKLGDDGQDEPVRDLRQALRAAGVDSDEFWIPRNGESRTYTTTGTRVARIATR